MKEYNLLVSPGMCHPCSHRITIVTIVTIVTVLVIVCLCDDYISCSIPVPINGYLLYLYKHPGWQEMVIAGVSLLQGETCLIYEEENKLVNWDGILIF